MIKKDWNKIIKKTFLFKGRDSQKMEITPYRDWMILMGFFFLGAVALLAFNVYMSIAINSDNFFTTSPKSTGGLEFNKEGLLRVLSNFEDKKAISDKIKKEGFNVVDPSL